MHPVVPLGSITATSGWNLLKCLFLNALSLWFTVINDTIEAFVVNSTLEIYYSLCFLPGYKSCPFLPSQATLCDISIRRGIWCLTKLQWDKWMAEFWISCNLKMSEYNLCSFMAKKVKLPHKSLGVLQGVVCGSAAQEMQWVQWAAPGRLTK